MEAVAILLVRLVIILVGYIAAALASSTFIQLLFLGSAGLLEADIRPVAWAGLTISIPFVALLIAYFTFIPSVAAIFVAELFGRRDWLSYAGLGAAVGIAFIGMARGDFDTGIDLTSTPIALGIIGGGIVGGVAYWLVAGRSAGSWRSGQPPQLPTSPGPSGS
jgi:hypothetical protein